MKRRNPIWGCPRIAQQITLAFGIEIDKDVVRRVLAEHYNPSGSGGPSWLTFIGHAKDSLWSVDLFRCESVALRTYWVLVVMVQFTRRIVGFGIRPGVVDGEALCRMFNHAIRGSAQPKYLSSDHDPLYRFHQWQANLRILEILEIKTVPYVPLSVPGTIDRNATPRMLGSDVVLDGCRPRSKAARFPTLLQRTSNTCRIGRDNAGKCEAPTSEF
jgi:putative transposase